MNIDDRLRQHLDAEAEGTMIAPGSAADVAALARSRSSRRRLVGSIAAIALVAGTIGGVVALRNDDPAVQISVAADADGSATSNAVDQGAESSNGSTGGLPAVGSEDGTPAVEPVPEAEPPIGMEVQWGAAGWSSPTIVHGEDGFAGLRGGPDGPVAIRSTDGVTWTEEPAQGLPESSIPTSLVARDGTYAALFLDFPTSRDDLTAAAEGTSILGWSTDLVTWSSLPLPADAADGRVTTYDSLVLGSNDAFVVTGIRFLAFDPTMEEDFADQCTTASDENGVSVTCEGAAGPCEVPAPGIAEPEPGTDPDRSPQPPELPPAPPVGCGSGIGLGGPLDLSNAPSAVALTGTLGGPITLVDPGLGDHGFVAGLAATDDAFVVVARDEAGFLVTRSTDGVNWIRLDVDSQFRQGDVFGGLAAADGRLTAIGFCESNLVAWTSDDNGTTWAMTMLPFSDGVDGFVDRVRSGPGRSVAALIVSLPSMEEVNADPSLSPPIEAGFAVAYTTDGETWASIDLASAPETRDRVVIDMVMGDDEILVQVSEPFRAQSPADSLLEPMEAEWVRIAL